MGTDRAGRGGTHYDLVRRIRIAPLPKWLPKSCTYHEVTGGKKRAVLWYYAHLFIFPDAVVL